MSDRFYRDAQVNIDLDKIGQNYDAIKAEVNKKIIAVVKSNAYGHGSRAVARYLEEKGVDFFAVGTLDEAIELRMHGIKSKILVLGIINPKDINKAIQHRVAITAPSKEWLVGSLDSISEEYDKEVWIHIKVNGHMNRYGTKDIAEIKEMIELIHNSKYFVYEGLFSHFAMASVDKDHAVIEREEFKKIVDSVDTPEYIHISNTAGALLVEDEFTNAVRVGIGLYGYYPSEYTKKHTDVILQPALDLICQVADTHEVKKGETVGYDESFIAETDMSVVTIPIGYGDGLLRKHSGYHVEINGEQCQIVGRVCMDATMISSNAKRGDVVKIIVSDPNSRQSLENFSNYVDTISYESTCLLSRRLPRVYDSESNKAIFNEILK
ncbi:alanine racemase [Phocicoccus pinnipedialis]|uniref:Alanine racemase n=1 Tax=Phocicoccus pinnipedialis TaxID=110845 RepID=A0A6V7R544_9BACL|nr:alanine racemase [Jeotgalicoccus pinnipedialis]MBP1939914.1 alanine racemase [Jeotgalicoccus pinnipedialis]CAD2072138.1 Alanine racemase 1 [Jeotgalicoccus pinnipedialis]